MKEHYIKRADVYALFPQSGTAKLHVADIDVIPSVVIDNGKIIKDEAVKNAEQCLIDNGIEPDEAATVLQALGYILFDTELYPDEK